MGEPVTRIFLPGEGGRLSVLEIPTKHVAVSLFNEAVISKDGAPKTFRFEGCWANGDAVEIVVRRVPAKEAP